MIKLTDLITESGVTSDLKKIETALKRKVGNDTTFDFSTNKKERGPRGYEKNHPVLTINKGDKKNQISITIGGDYEIEYGYEMWVNMARHSFKSHDIGGIINKSIKWLNRQYRK